MVLTMVLGEEFTDENRYVWICTICEGHGPDVSILPVRGDYIC